MPPLEKNLVPVSGLTLPNLVRIAVFLPSFGFVFCILLSYLKNFEVKNRLGNRG
jgi:hypothetical protein